MPTIGQLVVALMFGDLERDVLRLLRWYTAVKMIITGLR